MEFLLANRWNESIDPTGWLVSEKLDGWRAIWNGSNFISRNNNIIKAPQWFTKEFPKDFLDGEIWAGRSGLEQVIATASGSRDLDWRKVVYSVFDAPNYKQIFEKRLQYINDLLKNTAHIFVLPMFPCESKSQLLQKLESVVSAGGEGLMLRKPNSFYERKRSDTLLKVTKQYTDEGVVIGHVEGKRPGICGSLKVITKDGRIFKVAGLTEKLAHNPPQIGSVITYKYRLLTSKGIPRPATFDKIRTFW